MIRPPVVVIGLDCPTGLQTARSFAARGIEVIGLATDLEHACARTRSCGRFVEVEAGEAPLVDALMRLGPQLDGTVAARGQARSFQNPPQAPCGARSLRSVN